MELVKKILRFAVILGFIYAAGYFGYRSFFKEDTGSDLVTVTTPSAAQIKAGRDFLVNLNNLRVIKLDSSVFNQRAFTALKDISVILPSEPKGRSNPFSPIDSDTYVNKSESETSLNTFAQ